MKLFVSEYVCGGGWSDDERPLSLIREGHLMLSACVCDARDAGCQVVTTWDRRLTDVQLASHSGIEVHEVSGPEDEQHAFSELCESVDGVLVIAPEFNDELSHRVRRAREHCSMVINGSVESIDLCGDKWEFFRHCQSQGLPTIPTCRAQDPGLKELSWPRVLKLRWGAGSQQMQLVKNPSEWVTAINQYDAREKFSEPIIQPYVCGDAISVGALVAPDQRVELFPIADQFITPSMGFSYSGGRIPSRWNTAPIRELALRVLQSIAGLRGYVGIDMLVPQDQPDHPLVVELNPRMTTSWIGYRRLCQQNLVERLLGLTDEPLRWSKTPVTFDCEGVLH